jgi:hypothetical protein
VKRFLFILVLLAVASPAWCAKRITVSQLGELLHSLQQDKKGDADVAAALKPLDPVYLRLLGVSTGRVEIAPSTGFLF